MSNQRQLSSENLLKGQLKQIKEKCKQIVNSEMIEIPPITLRFTISLQEEHQKNEKTM